MTQSLGSLPSNLSLEDSTKKLCQRIEQTTLKDLSTSDREKLSQEAAFLKYKIEEQWLLTQQQKKMSDEDRVAKKLQKMSDKEYDAELEKFTKLKDLLKKVAWPVDSTRIDFQLRYLARAASVTLPNGTTTFFDVKVAAARAFNIYPEAIFSLVCSGKQYCADEDYKLAMKKIIKSAPEPVIVRTWVEINKINSVTEKERIAKSNQMLAQMSHWSEADPLLDPVLENDTKILCQKIKQTNFKDLSESDREALSQKAILLKVKIDEQALLVHTQKEMSNKERELNKIQGRSAKEYDAELKRITELQDSLKEAAWLVQSTFMTLKLCETETGVSVKLPNATTTFFDLKRAAAAAFNIPLDEIVSLICCSKVYHSENDQKLAIRMLTEPQGLETVSVITKAHIQKINSIPEKEKKEQEEKYSRMLAKMTSMTPDS